MTTQQAMAELNRRIKRGLSAAAIECVNDTKLLISVPAPRAPVYGTVGGKRRRIGYRATTRATPGAPPRKVSGQLRASTTWDLRGTGPAMVARCGVMKKYGRFLEDGNHPFLSVNLRKNRLKYAATFLRFAA